MKTRDGFEIKKDETVFSARGESLQVRELFQEETNKVIVIPIYHIKSMYVTGDGGHHQEVDTDIDYEGEDRIVSSGDIFKKAPTARIDQELKKKKEELDRICLKIGLARTEYRYEQGILKNK